MEKYTEEHYDEFIKTGNNNLFEEIIDNMILNGIDGIDDTIRNTIRNLSIKQKRLTILAILDKDRMLFKKIKALVDNSIDRTEHIS